MKVQNITGNLVDILNQKVYPATVKIVNGKINSISLLTGTAHVFSEFPFLLPGFIDAHVHIESSLLIPSEFARLAVVHGTVGTVSDPHEIANVCGLEGVEFMIENGKTVPFKFNFGAPSCVPATIFETAGAALNAAEVENLLNRNDILYLSEMMNFPGVLLKDKEVENKIAAAHAVGKPVDGHAPGLRGKQVQQYIDAGISTDHECFTYEEALDKLQRGMKILIREGSAAKNFEALINLLNEYPTKIMFCSDDKHPDSLLLGHINQLCARAVAKGISVYAVLMAACINPVLHYNLPIGMLREGDDADFIVVKDLVNFTVLQTYINGELVAEKGKSLINKQNVDVRSQGKCMINNFLCDKKNPADFSFKNVTSDTKTIPVIEALDGQLITNRIEWRIAEKETEIVSDTNEDILKIVVINRYQNAPVAKGFIKNVGLKRGAIASSVSHDSHNIVAVGVDDESICKAVNLIIKEKGGLSCIDGQTELLLALPVAGLMSPGDAYEIAETYTTIDRMAKFLGSGLSAPFMTISFMALLVIPHIKLSDKGLFDGDTFKFISRP